MTDSSFIIESCFTKDWFVLCHLCDNKKGNKNLILMWRLVQFLETLTSNMQIFYISLYRSSADSSVQSSGRLEKNHHTTSGPLPLPSLLPTLTPLPTPPPLPTSPPPLPQHRRCHFRFIYWPPLPSCQDTKDI